MTNLSEVLPYQLTALLTHTHSMFYIPLVYVLQFVMGV